MRERTREYSRQSLNRYKAIVAENPSNPKPTLFTKLLNDKRFGMTDHDIINDAESYIVAGSDTTMYILTSLVYSVCKNPKIRDTLAGELATLPDNFTDKDARSLKYLDQVISEALRVYPPVAGLPRSVPPEGAEFAGYPIPGGVTVTTQIYSLNRDENLFPNQEA